MCEILGPHKLCCRRSKHSGMIDLLAGKVLRRFERYCDHLRVWQSKHAAINLLEKFTSRKLFKPICRLSTFGGHFLSSFIHLSLPLHDAICRIKQHFLTIQSSIPTSPRAWHTVRIWSKETKLTYRNITNFGNGIAMNALHSSFIF